MHGLACFITFFSVYSDVFVSVLSGLIYLLESSVLDPIKHVPREVFQRL